jgi:hypothetical protein
MQQYYIKKAKECEAAVVALQGRLERMSKSDTVKLQAQMIKVKRELQNYKAAVDKATVDA